MIIPDNFCLDLDKRIFGFVEAIEHQRNEKFNYLLNRIIVGHDFDYYNQERKNIFEVIFIRDQINMLECVCNIIQPINEFLIQKIIDSAIEFSEINSYRLNNNIFYLTAVKHPAINCLEYIFNKLKGLGDLSDKIPKYCTHLLYLAVKYYSATNIVDAKFKNVLNFLINNQADIFCRFEGMTLLQHAVTNLPDDMGTAALDVLLKKAAHYYESRSDDNNAKDETDYDYSNRLKYIELVNHPCQDNKDNALHIAIKMQKKNMAIKLLNAMSINAIYTDSERLTPIYRALILNEEFACTLLKHARLAQVNLNWCFRQGDNLFSVVHHAVYNRQKLFLNEVIQFENLDTILDTKDAKGRSPQKFAEGLANNPGWVFYGYDLAARSINFLPTLFKYQSPFLTYTEEYREIQILLNAGLQNNMNSLTKKRSREDLKELKEEEDFQAKIHKP